MLPTNDITAAQVYSTAAGYKMAFAKVYGSIGLTGNSGAGDSHVKGTDAGFTDFVRLFWKLQELPTDEAVIGWGDAGLPDLHKMNWSAPNQWLFMAYYRSFYQITVANDFIRQSSDAKLAERGISGADADNIRKYRAEARFLRAYQYWVLMDLFGKPAFITDADPLGSTIPKQASRSELFTYIENELKAIEPLLVAPRTNEYGRVDRAAAWALLGRLYLNAEVYTGTPKYAEAVTYSSKVITQGGYTLLADYRKIMRADNHLNNTEAIFTVNYDGLKTQNWGGTTFLTHASVGGSMAASAFGIDGGWGGIRTTKNLVNLFPDATGNLDQRSQFHTAGQNLDINDIGAFTDGYAVTKFRNIKADGTPGSNLTFMDIDFPLIRLGEQYLIYAEAVLRGGTGGSLATATTYINMLRTRAAAASIVQANLTLPFILDERGRELYWEGHRRTDLIRFGKFTDASYLWPFKGDLKAGKGVESWRSVYPIPSDELVANPNLTQNSNY